MLRVNELYAQLISTLRPAGGEEELRMKHFIAEFAAGRCRRVDYHLGNVVVEVGDDRATMFTCHVDTANHRPHAGPNWHMDDKGIMRTDGKSNLGADDASGIYIMLRMIEAGVPGDYYFFHSEEVGGIGSQMLADYEGARLSRYKRAVAFDRCGTGSIITHQMGERCCSDVFANELSTRLRQIDKTLTYYGDNTGVFTDTANFMDFIPECTNISVGYYDEHTVRERQDVPHLEKLVEACIEVSWSNLPTVRDPSAEPEPEIISTSEWVAMHDMVRDNPDLITDMLVDQGYDITELTQILSECYDKYQRTAAND